MWNHVRRVIRDLNHKIGLCHDQLHFAQGEIKNTGKDLEKKERDLSTTKEELDKANIMAQMAALSNAELSDDKRALENDYHTLNSEHIAFKSKSARELDTMSKEVAKKDEMINNFTITIGQLHAEINN